MKLSANGGFILTNVRLLHRSIKTESDKSAGHRVQIIENILQSTRDANFYQEHFTLGPSFISASNSRDLITERNKRNPGTRFAIGSLQQVLFPLSCFIKITNKLHDGVVIDA